MTTRQTPPRPVPEAVENALLRLHEHHGRIVLLSGRCYLLSDVRPLCISDDMVKALSDGGWITEPEPLDEELSHCRVTHAGKEKARNIRAVRNSDSKYKQLPLEGVEEEGELVLPGSGHSR
jgi:hypothetical protein